jgi:S-adenosylmethionine synthetase
MIRISEMVLPGHPDKFCDQIADAIVNECQKVDPFLYCQVEVGIWYNQIWLSGSLVTTKKLPRTLEEIVVKTGHNIGYKPGNHIDASNYKIINTVCQQVGPPYPWTGKVNDQCIAIGYAGYDALTHYLPPEHFLTHILRLAFTSSFKKGKLKGQGPDGKILVQIQEEPRGWFIERILVTIQQKEETEFMDFCGEVNTTLKDAYERLRLQDPRWKRTLDGIDILVNPNGPLINGGSESDNGQTGRKLVMDFYGPRVPIGGGALSGKDITHIDRAASYCAREAAVRAVQSGARECRVRLAYAPNDPNPLDVEYTMERPGMQQADEFWNHESICKRYRGVQVDYPMSRGGHFFDPRYPWNGLTEIENG